VALVVQLCPQVRNEIRRYQRGNQNPSDGQLSHQYQRIDQSPSILNCLAYKRLRQMTFKIQVLEWSRHTHVVELSLLIGSYPSTSPCYQSLENLIKLHVYTYIFIDLFESFCNKIQHKHTTFDCLLLCRWTMTNGKSNLLWKVTGVAFCSVEYCTLAKLSFWQNRVLYCIRPVYCVVSTLYHIVMFKNIYNHTADCKSQFS
jgi:hypothetical protein